MTRPTPFFILAVFAIVLAVIAVTIVFTTHNAAMEKRADALLNPPMCVSPTGHKRVPCPKGNL